MAEFKEDMMQEEQDNGKELVSWITARCNDWRDYRDTNYLDDWEPFDSWSGY